MRSHVSSQQQMGPKRAISILLFLFPKCFHPAHRTHISGVRCACACALSCMRARRNLFVTMDSVRTIFRALIYLLLLILLYRSRKSEPNPPNK